MHEADVIKKSHEPITQTRLQHDLEALGIHKGDTLLVHSSLSAIGWVVGREITVIEALLAVVGQEGTIVMPSFTGENSDPARWQNPPVPQDWIKIIQDNMPPFDPQKTPTREMGRIAEAFWHYPGVHRSNHPEVSFSAYGHLAKELTKEHPLSPGFGPSSPLYKLYEMHAKVLLLGVGYGNCTCLHLCEVMRNDPQTHFLSGARILENGRSVWKTFDEIDYDDGDFPQLGEDYEKNYPVSQGFVGMANCRLIDMYSLCQYGFTWMNQHRSVVK